MQFRTKLLCILAVPVLGLVTIAAVAGSDRRSTASEMRGLRERIDVVSTGVALADSVQREQAFSARAVASTGKQRAGLDEQRVATDQAAKAWSAAIADAGLADDPAYRNAVDPVRESIAALPVYRDSVDQGVNTTAFVESYERLSTALNGLGRVIAQHAEDPRLARDAAAVAALSDAKAAAATEWSAGVLALAKGVVERIDRPQLVNAVAARDRATGVFEGLASVEAAGDLRTTLTGPPIATTDDIERQLLAESAAVSITADANAWWEGMAGRVDLMGEVLGRQLAAAEGRAAAIQAGAERDLRGFAILAGAIIALSVVLGLILARSMSRPICQLTRAAERLANEQLPALVSGLKSPSDDDQRFLAATMQPIDIRSGGELGKLANAFNAVQTVAVDVAAEQAQLLRKGISEIFVNLARRNQVLIDRQLEYLDDIEATEDNPEQLAQLYRLDHLATRMRRNAESLLVLAGQEPARKRTRAAALVDVVRAAMAEVEDYARIDITGFDEVDITGSAAVDVAHLVAELLENATQFSAPDTRVEVEGRRTRGGYLVSIIDHGVGMGASQVDEANTLLAAPPPVGLAFGRSLGFTVVARLSARYGTSVRLMAAPSGGLAAVVHLPARLLVEGAGETPAPPVRPAAPVTAGAVSAQAPLGRVIDAAWEADLVRVGNGGNGNGNGNGNGGNGSTVTAAGLARRVPQRPASTAEETDRPVPNGEPIGASRRSPDDVRAMLARYREGLQRGRTGEAEGDDG